MPHRSAHARLFVSLSEDPLAKVNVKATGKREEESASS
jgi:hypothetical protein